jgi:hypothetical protein
VTPELDLDRTPVRRLEFVEVGTTVPVTTTPGRRATQTSRKRAGTLEPVALAMAASSGSGSAADADFAIDGIPAQDANQRGSGEPRWSLWGDAEG